MARVRNLYSIKTNQAAIAALFRVVNRYVGNLAPMPGVFPDSGGPQRRHWHRVEHDAQLSMFRTDCGENGLPFLLVWPSLDRFGRDPPKGQPTPIELLRQHHDLGALLLMRLAAFGPASRCALAVAGSLQLGNQRGFFELGDCTEHLPHQHRGRGVRQKEVRRTGRHQFNTELAQVVVAGELHRKIARETCRGSRPGSPARHYRRSGRAWP